MIDPSIPTEPTIPCACGRGITEVEMTVEGRSVDLCMACVYELFPEQAVKIAEAYRIFHEAAYGYEPGARN